ncbi:DUF3826 domain-containing protein [Flavobacterium sp. LBUM151]
MMFSARSFASDSRNCFDFLPEYIKVTNERASKIVAKLELANPEKEKAVTDIIAQQFRNLSEIQDGRDAEIKKIKEDTTLAKEKQNEKIDKLKATADKSIEKLHKSYLKKLGTQLSEDRITEVKDGMTYGVLPKIRWIQHSRLC